MVEETFEGDKLTDDSSEYDAKMVLSFTFSGQGFKIPVYVIGIPIDITDLCKVRKFQPTPEEEELLAELDRQIPGITGVWMPSDVRGGVLLIISIKQMYPGHAKQVGMFAAGCYAAGSVSRYIIIVDDDIDPSNIGDVLWAVTTRCDPESAIDILKGTWTMRSDPLLSPEKRGRDQIEASKAILYGCRPYSWIKDFPPSTRIRPELLKQIRSKFPNHLGCF